MSASAGIPNLKPNDIQVTMNLLLFSFSKRLNICSLSFDTLKKTIRLYIGEYDIGHIRLSCVDSDMVQRHLKLLNEKGYSYSIIKKCHDALHEFFAYAFLSNKVQRNPMDIVVLIKKGNVKKATKKIQFMEKEDISKFISEATKLLENGEEKYTFGFPLAANIYLGMRVGELLALSWADIDFDCNTIHIDKNLQSIENEQKNENDVLSKKKRKYKYVIQSVKNDKERTIYMNDNAKEILQLHYCHTKFKEPNDYVCATKKGKHAVASYLSDNIAEIQENAETKLRYKGTHMIRHTCASLYFRAGVRIELIAAMLGHSVDVCRETYLHFVEEQKKEAVRLITDFEKVDL